MIQIAVVAQSILLRAGLQALLATPVSRPGLVSGEEVDLEVVATASTLRDLDIEAIHVDVFLVAGPAGILEDGLSWLKEHRQTTILWLAEDAQNIQILINLPMRAWGVLSLETSAEEIQAAVYALYEGLWVGDPRLLRSVFGESLAASAGIDHDPLTALTEREVEVLQLLAHGLANKQIALRLGISEHTVKFHVSAIYSKFGATNRTEAVRLGVQRGLVAL